MTLQLKDITNLPSNLPISLIPQQQQSGLTQVKKQCPLDHPQQQQLPASQNSSKGFEGKPKQWRVSLLSGNDSGYEMDDSLTDMQWLQKMDAGSDFPGLKHGPPRKQRVTVKGSRTPKDGCRKKLDYTSKKSSSNKPPLSYASLISLAICSTPQRMMTLSGIYRWIEYTFPFYRTPEAKAWKNSIRHNLSIRKNMFMKVYQYPPRRGNGSYWTLLSDGEEELKKAVPLFTTLQPPIIDSNCAYHHEPSTYTVKSKGKYVPVLPRSELPSGGSGGGNSNLPYFSFESSGGSKSYCPDPHSIIASNEITVGGDADFSEEVPPREPCVQSERPKHLCDHSYAKSWTLEEEVAPANELFEERKVLEVGGVIGRGGRGARGVASTWEDGDGGEESGEDEECVSTPKRKRISSVVAGRARFGSLSSNGSGSGIFRSNVAYLGNYRQTIGSSPPAFATTPPKDHDTSLNLLETSFLTPLKNFVPDVEIGAISFSPLYANLITPKQDTGKQLHNHMTPTTNPHPHPFLSSPLTPLKGSLDSGIFSPLQSDTLGGMKFSTPTNLSPLGDLKPELYPLKLLDNSGSSSNTPLRPGSLQPFGLPGLTPPPPSSASSDQ